MRNLYFLLLGCLCITTINGIFFHALVKDFDDYYFSTYDFIVIGSGSSGSVLASRLSEIPHWKVLLLEVGKRPLFVNDIPMTAPLLQFTDFNWGYKMEKTPGVCLGLENQSCPWPRGRGLGGTTLINYMIYTRGHRSDFDTWAADGNPGWTYDEVLPFYKYSERCRLRYQDEGYHGTDGLLNVEEARYGTPLRKTFIEAGRERGYPYVDYNGRSQEGFSYAQSNTRNGHRHSGYRAFIQPAELRPNLHVLTESRATKLLIDPVTKQVYGVQFVKNRQYHYVNATKEVIVAAGALASPQLLMLSGIGPREHLEKHQIPVVKDLPGVGKNLHDHICFPGLTFLVNDSVASDQRLLESPEAFINWVLYGKGPLTMLGGVEALGYFHTNVSQGSGAPDIEFIFLSGQMHLDKGINYRKTLGITDQMYNTVWKPLEGIQSYTILPMLMHPKSIGHLELKSKNPYNHPRFYGNYLSDPDNIDIKTLIVAIKEIIELSRTSAFQKYGSKLHDIKIPGCEQYEFASDEYWECAIRHIATTLHHQVGTCKMGPKKDPMAVVDNRCRVHGIKNLRVVDTSVIPFALTAHTNAPAYMVGEKIAHEIKRRWKVL